MMQAANLAEKEKLRPLSDLAKFEIRGIQRSADTYRNWADKRSDRGGAVGRDRQRHYLQAVVVAGVLHSSIEWVELLIDEMNEGGYE